MTTLGEIMKAAIARRDAALAKAADNDDSKLVREALSAPAGKERAAKLLEIARRQAPARPPSS